MDFEQLDRLLVENVSSGKVSGCCAAVTVGGKTRYLGFAGESNREEHIPVGERTVFRLASMTKPITAAAVLLCVQDGILGLGEKIADILPEFREMYVAEKTESGFVRGKKAGEITLLHLLTHSSGIGSGEVGDLQSSCGPHEGDTLASAVSRYGGLLLDFDPGTAQMYSPVMGFDVAARIVEIRTGIPYGEFLEKRIFSPLGMRCSYLLERFPHEQLAVTYAHRDGELIPEPLGHNFDLFPHGYTGGGAGLMTDLVGYVRFAEMLRRALEGEEEILTRESVEAMRKPWLGGEIAGVYDFFNWGLGVRALAAQYEWQPLTAGSFGWSGAYGTHFWVDPQKRTTAVYMHNSATYGGAGAPHMLEFERAVMKALED